MNEEALRSMETDAPLQEENIAERTIDSEFIAPTNLIEHDCQAITPEMLALIDLAPEDIERVIWSVPGGVRNVQDIYPLSPPQEGLLFHHVLNESCDTYLLSTLFELESYSQVGALVYALGKAIERHDALRSAVVWEKLPRPVQVVYRHAVLPVEQVPLDPDRDALEQLRERMRPGRHKMDLSRAPLLRLQVAADPAGQRWYALLQRHHIVFDHQSWNGVFADAMAYVQGRESSLPAPKPYRDYVAWSQVHARTQEAEAFFRAKLGDLEEPTAPFGCVDVHGDGSDSREARQVLDPALAGRLRQQAERHGVSAARLFHAAWALLVARASDSDDVVFGTVLLARARRYARGQRPAGMFVNTLPLRLQLHDVTATQLVEQTDRELRELLSFENAPLTLAQRCGGTGQAPLFTAVLNYRYSARHSVVDQEAVTIEAAGIRVLMQRYVTNYPVCLTVDNFGDRFALIAQTRTIEPGRIICYLETVLRSLVDALEQEPDKPALALAVLPERELHDLIVGFNATHAEYPSEKLIHELVEEQTQRVPEALAVAYRAQSLTYAQLDSKANRLARYLIEQGVGPDRLVGLYVERGVEMLIGVLGVLKAGGAYLPLDPGSPIERLLHVLREGRPQLVLTQHALLATLPSCGQVLTLDGDWERIAGAYDDGPLLRPAGLDSRSLAYVIYTSGSTGKPKGVMVEHRNLVNYSVHAARQFDVAGGDGSLVCTSISFDLMLTGLYPTLISGRPVRLCPEQRGLPELAEEILQCRNLAPLKLTPSHLTLLEPALRNGQLAGRVRVLVLGGEPLHSSLVRLWNSHAPATRIFNHYGPTETTVGCVVNEALELSCDSVPIGRPISNTRIYVLNHRLQPVPVGVIGEIYIAGAGVARGYLRQPALTEERFLRDPFSGDPADRMYKSGDLGRRREDGVIECLGRLDHQVKIRGHRIELGEIETQLVAHEQVKEVVVLAREDSGGEKRLVAYVVPQLGVANGESTQLTSQLREHIKVRLPDYMVPALWVVLERLPLTLNGKVDRHALPLPQSPPAEAEYVAPATELEQAVADIWAALLRLDRVGAQDNFFEIGGHSLLAMQVVTRVRSDLSISIPLRSLFDSPTVRQLCKQMECLREEHLRAELADGGDDIDELLGSVASMSDAAARELIRNIRMRIRP